MTPRGPFSFTSTPALLKWSLSSSASFPVAVLIQSIVPADYTPVILLELAVALSTDECIDFPTLETSSIRFPPSISFLIYENKATSNSEPPTRILDPSGLLLK